MRISFDGTLADILHEMDAVMTASRNGQCLTPASEPPTTRTKSETVKTAAKESSKPAEAPAPSPAMTVADAIPKLVAKITKDKTLEVLAKYGAKRGSEVKAEDVPKFLAECQTLLA